jgi:hypothetical protein
LRFNPPPDDAITSVYVYLCIISERAKRKRGGSRDKGRVEIQTHHLDESIISVYVYLCIISERGEGRSEI